MARILAYGICPKCRKPVTDKNAIAIARVRVCSKPKTWFGLSMISIQNWPSHTNRVTRQVSMPRYLVHEKCLMLPIPEKEMLYDLEVESRVTDGVAGPADSGNSKS